MATIVVIPNQSCFSAAPLPNPDIVFNICSAIFIFYFRVSLSLSSIPCLPLGICFVLLKATRLINNFMKVLTRQIFILLTGPAKLVGAGGVRKVESAKKS